MLVREETVGMARALLAPAGSYTDSRGRAGRRNPKAAECFPRCCSGAGVLLSQDSSRKEAQGAVHAGSPTAVGVAGSGSTS